MSREYPGMMMNGGAGLNGSITTDISPEEHPRLRHQRNMGFPTYPTRPRTASKDSQSQASRPATPVSPHLPQMQFSSREDPMPSSMTPQRPLTSFPGAGGNGNESRSFSSPQVPQSYQRPSEASRLRALNNGYRSRSTERKDIGEQPDNFSRPRGISVHRRRESPRPLQQSNTFPLRSNDDDNTPTAADARERGLSTSSSQSALFQPAIPLRPSMSIPDYHTPDSIYSRQRNLNNSHYRPARGLSRPDSNYSSHYHDGVPRPAGFDTDEVRASFRSALTTNSSFMGTSGTERSSVLTKSSSATSIYGKDEGFSVDDAIGMYESGFQDSGVEDNDDMRPSTADSIQRKKVLGLQEAMNDTLAPPTIPAPLMRDSTAFFRPGLAEDMPAPPPPPKMLNTPAANGDIRDSTAFFRPGFGMTPSPDKSSGLDGNTDVEEGYFEQKYSSRPATRPGTETFDSTRDRYGFRKATQHVSLEQYEAWNGPYTEHISRRRKKWVVLQKKSGLITDNPDRFPPQSDKVKGYVRKGIPPEWRGAAWFYYAGGPAQLAKHYGVYDSLVRQAAAGGVTETDDEIIERDLNRTFPDNVRFKPDPPPEEARNSHYSAPETPILQSLRRVLQAFSIYNPKIGYCQSLNFLAGMLLLFMDEEKSFWMLNIITRDYLPGTHEVNLEGANVDLGVLMAAIKDMMPSIWAKIGGELDGTPFTSQTMRLPPITLCTTAWFMSCFIGTLPVETTLRVWDSFFYEGSKTLFRIALTIFKIGEVEIKAVTDPMEIFQVVQTIPRRLIDANLVMGTCFKRRNGFGHLSQNTIERGRVERRQGYARERGESEGIPANRPPGRKNTLFRKRRGATEVSG